MASLEYFLVCESVSVDQRTNSASLFNILDEIRANDFPMSIPKAVVTSAWNYEDGDEDIDYQVKVHIFLPGEKMQKPGPMNVRIEPNRHRLFLEIVNLRVQEPGELKFEIFINDEYVARYTVLAVKGQQ